MDSCITPRSSPQLLYPLSEGSKDDAALYQPDKGKEDSKWLWRDSVGVECAVLDSTNYGIQQKPLMGS